MPDQSSAATEHAILQEITAPLETLPEDPVALVRAEFPVALRGYDRLAVDAYVQRTAQLVAELHATRSPEAAVRRALERVGEQISGILQRAHETAEQITTQSRREAEDRLEQARAEANEVAAAAAQRVHDLDADTDRIWMERHRIVDDARDLASQLLALAEAAAERFPEDASQELEQEPVAEPSPAAATEPGPTATATPAAAVEPELDEDYEDEDDQDEGPPDDVGATRAFSPLELEQQREPKEREEPTPTRSVIPPASQAAHRRTTE